jgi:hypothetical protein
VPRSILLIVYLEGARLDVTGGGWRVWKKEGSLTKITGALMVGRIKYLFRDTLIPEAAI